MKRSYKILLVILVIAIAAGGYFYKAFYISSLSYQELSRYAYETLELPNGLKINYRDQGNPNGQTLLLIHGGADSLGAWDDWVPYLEQDYRVVRFDMPGHGLSDRLPPELALPEPHADVTEQIVNQLKLKDFVIVGHSFGGDTATRYVLKYPGKAAAMVLIGPGGFRQDFEVEQGAPVVDAWQYSIGRWLLTYTGDTSNSRDGYADVYHDTASIPQARLDRYYDLDRYEKNRGYVMEFIVNYLTNYTILQNLDTIKVPTLLLWGEHDPNPPVEVAQLFQDGIPDTTLVVYQGVSHMVQNTVPEKSTADLIRFMEEKLERPAEQ